VYSQHVPRLQVFLSHSIRSSGGRLGGTSAHGDPPMAIPFMITQEQSNRDNGLILMQDLHSTWTGSEQWDITHHQWRPEYQMPIWGHWSSLWISL